MYDGHIFIPLLSFPVKERNFRDMGLAKKRKKEHSRQFPNSDCKEVQVSSPYASKLPFCSFPISWGPGVKGHCSCMQGLAHGKLEGQVQLTSSKDTRGNSLVLKVRHVMQMPDLRANLFKVPQWSVETKCLSQKQSWDLVSEQD